GPSGWGVAVCGGGGLRGLIFGNTWFWPADRLPMKLFSRVMSSAPMQRAILKNNFFVERLIPAGISRELTSSEMRHYPGVQPTPEARVGVAEFPRQVVADGSWLLGRSVDVEGAVAGNALVLVWGMKDLEGMNSMLGWWDLEIARKRVGVPIRVELSVQGDKPAEIHRGFGGLSSVSC